MPDNNEIRKSHDKPEKDPKFIKKSRGLPITNTTTPMPTVKPPKKEADNNKKNDN